MSALVIQPVKRRRLYEEIVDQLATLIISGAAPPGTQLPSERELVEQFQVGRTAIREALFALQKMGMVTLSGGERPVVVVPTSDALVAELSGAVRYHLSRPTGMRDFQGARAFLEIGLVRHAAKHATRDEIKRLAGALKANEAALGDTEKFIDTDVAFHFVFAEIAKNPIFTALHAALAEWLRDQRATGVNLPGSPEAAFAAHTRIFEAVVARDPDAAEQVMCSHLEEVAKFYWRGQQDSSR
jgi:DNA-binding FadR family transcriptional regulator